MKGSSGVRKYPRVPNHKVDLRNMVQKGYYVYIYRSNLERSQKHHYNYNSTFYHWAISPMILKEIYQNKTERVVLRTDTLNKHSEKHLLQHNRMHTI